MCRRCLSVLQPEVVAELSNDSEVRQNAKVQPSTSLPAGQLLEELKTEQKKEFGDDLQKYSRERGWVLTEEKLLARVTAGRARAVVPKSMTAKVCEWTHDSRQTGHWGVTRTATLVAEMYWWPGWVRDVAKVVEACVMCALAKSKPPNRQGPMRAHTPRRRFEIVAMDILTIKPASIGYKKILVIGDMLSRFVVAASQCCSERDVAKACLDRWAAIFGFPEVLVSDGGLSLQTLEDLGKQLGISKVSTFPHDPQGNGMIERYNRTLTTDLRILTAGADAASRESLLSLSVSRYNTTRHSVT